LNRNNETDHEAVEQTLDRLLDASDDERATILRNLEIHDAALARRARVLLGFALGGATIPDTIDLAAPDLFNALIGEDERERIGEQLGAYRITELIRRGGMGVVFLAERADGAYTQKVAVKLVPKTFTGAQGRALFERERVHLARLEHPNIARIIDAGVTFDETPYFIMEFIDGEPINRFADGLGLKERLRLFLQLCDAIAYCHRSLIVHGDIKPGNVLVAEHRVRLLDFGIGRFLGEEDRPDVIRRVGAFSPVYAAPEQLRGEKPTVLSDIYSLGALLYNVLTGQTADQKGDPGNQAAEVSQLPSDITAIIERCLSETPANRYESVDALRRDIEAYIDHYPVMAHQQTRAYRAQKFIRRNRLLTGATMAVIVGLGAGLATALWQYRIAQTKAMHAQQVTLFLNSLFDRASPAAAGEQDITLREIMDEAAARLPNELENSPEVRVEIEQLIANAYSGIGEYEKSFVMRQALLDYWRQKKRAPHIEIVQALKDLGHEYSTRGEYAQAAELHREAIDQLETLGMAMSTEAAGAWSRLGEALALLDPDGSLTAMRKAHEINLAIRADDGWEMTRSLANVAVALRAAGNFDEAMAVSEQALTLAEKNGEHLAPDILAMRCNLAIDYLRLGVSEKVRPALETCLAMRIERFGEDHPENVAAYNNLATLELNEGRLNKAEAILLTAKSLAQRKLPETSLARLAVDINYSVMLWQSGRSKQADKILDDALGHMTLMLGAKHPASNRVRSIAGRVKLELGQPKLADELITQSLAGLTPAWRADALLWLAESKLNLGNKSAAKRLATESLELRKSIPYFTNWQVAEAAYVQAVANNNKDGMDKAKIILDNALPENHHRRQSHGYIKTGCAIGVGSVIRTVFMASFLR
jgi:eukaryotic-like serine/threonine-protein kinase